MKQVLINTAVALLMLAVTSIANATTSSNPLTDDAHTNINDVTDKSGPNTTTRPFAAISQCSDITCVEYFKQMKKRSRQGYYVAKIELARMFYLGYGTDRKIKMAIQHYRDLATLNSHGRNDFLLKESIYSQYMLALIYLQPSDIQNTERGLRYLKQAKNNNYEPAIILLKNLEGENLANMLTKQDFSQLMKNSLAINHVELSALANVLQVEQLPKELQKHYPFKTPNDVYDTLLTTLHIVNSFKNNQYSELRIYREWNAGEMHKDWLHELIVARQNYRRFNYNNTGFKYSHNIVRSTHNMSNRGNASDSTKLK